MQYTNYAMKNNVFGTLSAPISSLATTIQLATGQGQRFTADMLATLESMEGNKVTKREIVKITNVTGDTLTVIRKFAPCPSNDDANTQGQVSYSFSADDTISVYITKEHFDKIDGSINDIYNNGSNKLRCEVVSGLQVKINPGPVLVGSAYYDFAGDTLTLTDNATNYVEIDKDGNLVSNTTAWGDKNTKIAKVTTISGAVTNIEDRRLGTVGGEIGGVNIHDLTEKEAPVANDELVISDSENIRQNKKIKVSSIVGYKQAICAEQINAGDIVGIIDNSIPNDNIDIGKTNNKIGIKVHGNGIESDFLFLYLGKVGNGQDITVRIETDNNGEPSGVLVSNDAVATVLASNLTTTLQNTKILLNGNVVLSKLEQYRVVLQCDIIDNSNYGIAGTIKLPTTNIKTNTGNSREEFNGEETVTNSVSGGSGSGLAYNFTLYITPNTNFIIKSITGYGQNRVQISGGTASYDGDGTNINILLLAGVQYTLNFPIAQSYVNYSSSVSVNSQYYTMSGGRANGGSVTISIELTNKPRCILSSDLIYQNYFEKVDTQNIDTFSDDICLAIQDGNVGEVITAAMNGGETKNDNWDLIPGQDYYFINNTITNTPPRNDTNYIGLGTAIAKNKIKVQIKKMIHYTGNTTPIIVPFSGLLWSSSAIYIDGNLYNYSMATYINKGQKVNLGNGSYIFKIFKV